MFSLAYVILPVCADPSAEAIRASLAPFQRGTRGTLPEDSLAFKDETDALRDAYQAHFIFSETGTGGLQIEGADDIFHLDTQKVRTQMKRLGLQRWSVRFADEMDLDAFFDRFGKRLERHPGTGAFGRWLNPLGQWDWWDLGGRFDGHIVADQHVKEGRSVAEISSGPNTGRVIFANLGDVLADALGQAQLPLVDVQGDRNIEMVATLLRDALEERENAFPATLVLPPGSVKDSLRWLGTYPQMGPHEALSWLGLEGNADRPHSALGGRTPDEAYHTIEPTPLPGRAPATASIRLAA
jgi:hypothetical protein